jgi:hypothetical protein
MNRLYIGQAALCRTISRPWLHSRNGSEAEPNFRYAFKAQLPREEGPTGLYTITEI